MEVVKKILRVLGAVLGGGIALFGAVGLSTGEGIGIAIAFIVIGVAAVFFSLRRSPEALNEAWIQRQVKQAERAAAKEQARAEAAWRIQQAAEERQQVEQVKQAERAAAEERARAEAARRIRQAEEERQRREQEQQAERAAGGRRTAAERTGTTGRTRRCGRTGPRGSSPAYPKGRRRTAAEGTGNTGQTCRRGRTGPREADVYGGAQSIRHCFYPFWHYDESRNKRDVPPGFVFCIWGVYVLLSGNK